MINSFIQKLTGSIAVAIKGFTLIETLVAVLILATAITGPLTIASKGLTTALVAKDQTTAYYLAQDAVEYIRFVRDSNQLQGKTWLAGLDASGNGHTNGPTGSGGSCVSADGSASCVVDSYNDTATPCAGTCPVLYYDATNRYFGYNTSSPNTATIYRRSVSIQTPVGSTAGEASVTVRVSWSDMPGVVHSINMRENMFNWQ